MADQRPDPAAWTSDELHRARHGDRVALGKLLLRHGCRIQQALRRQGIRNQDDLDELAQDVIAKVIGAIDGGTIWPDVVHFRGWVKRVAENTARDFTARGGKRRIQRHVESVDAEVPVADRVMGREPTPSQDAIRREQSAGNAAAAARRQARIARLAAPDRELLELREQRQLEFTAIAAAMSSSLGRPLTADALRMRYARLLEKVGPALA